MKKTKFRIKTMLTVLLVLTLIMSAVAPAFAAEISDGQEPVMIAGEETAVPEEAPEEEDELAEEEAPEEDLLAEEEAPAEEAEPEETVENAAAEEEESAEGILEEEEDLSGQCGDNVYWKISNGTLTFTGTGDMYDYNHYRPGYLDHPDEVTAVVVESGITSLPAMAFWGLKKAQTITLPSSGLTSIGRNAFTDCVSLKSVTIPEGITDIGSYCFSDSGLESLTLPNSATNLGSYLCRSCTSLKTVKLPDGLTTIRERFFMDCSALTDIEIPEGVKSIGSQVFRGCSSLQKITLPAGLESIGNLAFAYCSALRELTIPAAAKEIGEGISAHCSLLKAYKVDAANTEFTVVDGVLFNTQKTALVSYPGGKQDKSYTTPASTSVIWDGAFYGADNIVSLVVSEGVGKLDGEANFASCGALKSIKFSGKIPTLPKYAFENCGSLEEVTFSDGVNAVGSYAFYNDKKLNKVIFIGASPTFDSRAFLNAEGTAYYMEEFELTWADTVKQGYGGSIAWKMLYDTVKSISFSASSLELLPGEIEKAEIVIEDKYSYEDLTWTSSAPSVAAVDASGYVIAKKVGKTTITVKGAKSGCSAKCTVNVLFKDVTNKNYAPYTAIYDLNEKGIAAGFADGTFKPNDPVTRGQVLLFLWRAAGKPAPKSSKLTFKDAAEIEALPKDYKKAILWGVEKGITQGYTDGTFRPNENCSRGQIVTFLWRYKGKPAAKSGYTGSFPDVPKTHTFYKAVSWAASYKITTGFSNGTFGPGKKCTRGQCAAFIYRMLKLK